LNKGRDNWQNQNGIIKRIRSWIIQENITVEEAFRAFDIDFDGVVSKRDLKTALLQVLGVNPIHLTD